MTSREVSECIAVHMMEHENLKIKGELKANKAFIARMRKAATDLRAAIGYAGRAAVDMR